MADRYEINHEGNVVIGDGGLCKNQSKMLVSLFSQYGWTCTEKSQQGSCHVLELSNPNYDPLTINVFSGNIRDELRNAYEKKMQLGKDNDPRKFSKKNTIILGIYVYKDDDPITEAVFVGYPINDAINYPSNPSLRGDTFVNKLLLQAKNKGFVYNSEFNVVGFRSEFAFYYLDNFYDIHYDNNVNSETDDSSEEGLLSENNTCTPEEYLDASLEKREELYCAWLVLQDKLNGEGKYDEKTAYNYSLSLKNDARKLIGIYLRNMNLFSYISESEFSVITSRIKQCENYVQINQNGNYTFGNALRTYNDFLHFSKARSGCNKIFYGAPGCGKSRHVKEMLKDVYDKNIFRVTFHPEYMNCDFVGQILPNVTTEKDPITGKNKDIVSYSFNPGPFTLALKRAYQTNEMVYLVIEEINRGNAAAIFGDIFQLLDRVKSIDDKRFGYSEYPIRNTGVQDYLLKIGNNEVLVESFENVDTRISIPSNLTIFATMNSSDQNVFTMDTAFKRRWLFEQISNDIVKDSDHPYKNWYVPGTDVTWQTFVIKVNDAILNYKIQNQTNEDKRLGKYFVGKECLTETYVNSSDVIPKARNFAFKIFEYIWNDVCKIGREDWFDLSKYKTLEDLMDAFVYHRTDVNPLGLFRNIDFKN